MKGPKTPLPQWIAPCIPTLVDKPPKGPDWVHEIKWDGYRVSSYVEGGAATIRTRRGLDWTARFPAIAAALPGIEARSAIIDGEAVILDEKGKSSFAALQSALTRHGAEAAVLYAFDSPGGSRHRKSADGLEMRLTGGGPAYKMVSTTAAFCAFRTTAFRVQTRR